VRATAGEALGKAVDYETEGYRACAESCVQFAVAAGVFMRQKLAAVERSPVHRQARKRLLNSGWKGDTTIDVVRLRARETEHRDETESAESSGARDYHCRWIVRSHVRQQWYPSLSKHLPVLVGPHIKGPDDKPFKPRTTPLVVVNR
jgi:hypothetical protein